MAGRLAVLTAIVATAHLAVLAGVVAIGLPEAAPAAAPMLLHARLIDPAPTPAAAAPAPVEPAAPAPTPVPRPAAVRAATDARASASPAPPVPPGPAAESAAARTGAPSRAVASTGAGDGEGPRASPDPAGAPSPAPAEPPAAASSLLASAVFDTATPAARLATTASTAAASPAAAASAPRGGEPPPTYATRIPPPAQMEYALTRGVVGGTGRLRWAPSGPGYTMALEGSAFGISFISWNSEGGFDPAGLAPVRFVDRRRGKEARAANFQRSAGRITFSGPSVEYPLVAGAQDRLSWMIQVPAIVAAAPQRFAPGARIEMFVVGARGDGDVWTFEVVSRDALALPAGMVAQALHLRRAPRKPYDTEVDVWLDPARHHLPVRLRLAIPQTGEATDFALSSISIP